MMDTAERLFLTLAQAVAAKKTSIA